MARRRTRRGGGSITPYRRYVLLTWRLKNRYRTTSIVRQGDQRNVHIFARLWSRQRDALVAAMEAELDAMIGVDGDYLSADEVLREVRPPLPSEVAP